MIWLVLVATVLVIAVAVYSRWTEPVAHYGEARHRRLFATPSFLVGVLYGLVCFAWLFHAAPISDAQRAARGQRRAIIASQQDPKLQERAERMAAAEEEVRLGEDLKRQQASAAEWKSQRLEAVDRRAVEEMSSVVIEGAARGPCATLRGCVCGLAHQFTDSKILARRYRRWCRRFRSLDGEWMCRSNLQVVKSDLYRNRLVLLDKGLAIPSVCPQRQSN